MKPGLDLLGLSHPRFPFDKIITEVPIDTPIGWFWLQFGDSKPHFKDMLEKGFKIFRPQMYWSDDHKIVPMSALKEALHDLYLIIKDVPGITVYVSPSCEHAESSVSEVKARLDLVADLAKTVKGRVIPVNNPQKGRGAVVPGYLTELHGSDPGKCNLASTDGDNIYDIDAAQWVTTYGNRVHPAFIWGARFNLREISDPGQKPPPIKDRKAAPSVQYFRSVLRLLYPKGEAPAPSFQAQVFRAPNIYKTHAEDDQEPDENTRDELRENRPVLIMRPRLTSIDVLASNGQVICKFPYYGTYPGNLHRYYSGIVGGPGLYGYEIGRRAAEKSGSEFVWFKAGAKIFGPVHPAFRQGTYRG